MGCKIKALRTGFLVGNRVLTAGETIEADDHRAAYLVHTGAADLAQAKMPESVRQRIEDLKAKDHQ